MEKFNAGALGLLTPKVLFSRLERVLQLCANRIDEQLAQEIAAELISCNEREAKTKLREMGFTKDWGLDGTDGK